MRAIEITQPGKPEVLKPCERPMPELKAGEVLIRVHAAGINRPDVLQRKGVYPMPPGELFVNGTLFARAEVVVVDGQYAVRICELFGGGAQR